MADRGVNQVILLGRLVTDAEEKQTSSGSPYCWLKVAVNTERPGANRESKVEYIRCVFYNSKGTIPYLLKGRQVSIQGRLESYQKDKDSPLQMSVNVDRLILTANQSAGESQGNPGNADLERYVEELQERNASLEQQLVQFERSKKSAVADDPQSQKPATKKAASKQKGKAR